MKWISAFAASVVFSAAVQISFAVTDITFFAVSDTHYGQSSASKDANRIAVVDILNKLPGTAYPASVGGGPVGTPRAVLIPGDLIERPDDTLWKNYVADYGVNGEGRLKFPVYDGLGNHDVWNYSTSKTSTLVRDQIILRNAKRKGLANMDADHLHYSWDWDQVHFIHLNLFMGNTPGTAPQWDPSKSLDFLKADLEKNVGTSGRPVLVLQHFNIDTLQDYYQNSQKAAMMAILKNYNCIGILHGHSHSKKVYKYSGLDIYDDGTAMNSDILVFRITDGKMFVVNRLGNAWGAIALQKTITMGTPATRRAFPGGPLETVNPGFIFGVGGVGTVYAGNVRAKTVEVLDVSGSPLRHMQVTSAKMEWDRKDEARKPVATGLYLIRIRTETGIINAKVLLD